MAQSDLTIQNQSFPSFRSDLNDALTALNTTQSGTSRPSSAVAGTVWLDVTNATNPTLKFFDGTDDISLATLDYSANTVNWLDSTVSFDIVNDTTPQLGGNLDVNGNDIVSVSNGNITITPDGTGKVIISGLSFPTSDGTANQVLKTDGSGNLSFTDVSGGISWQSVQTTGFTAVAGNAYPCNTTSAGFTVTLPSTPSAGDQVQLVDYAGTFDTNALLIDPNGNDIEGGASSLQLSGEREGVILTYIDSTQGWIATSGINEGTDALEPVTYSIDFLVVAGGAGGGEGFYGGGGGAGGYRTSTQTATAGTVITVTVGDGGAGATSQPSKGVSGSNSSISGSGLTTITSAGGGGGASRNGGAGANGGSGGGNAQPPNAGGSGNTPSTSPSQGNNGGGGSGFGGGGGGASAVGGTGPATTPYGANGGNGTASSITGSSVTYAGGGAGGGDNVIRSGGTGGGGNGGTLTNNPVAGTVNTGGGGGGGGNTGDDGASGGKGVVILSMPDANYSGTTTGSPTVATGVSGKTVLTFTGSGSYTA